MAKRWHPDIAPPGRRHEHERHLQAINEAADQLAELADTSRGGRVTASAVRASAAAARKAREEAGRRAYEADQRSRAAAEDRAKHDPFGSRVPDHSVVHRYARCVSYPEWGVGTVSGIYFSGEGEEVQQWARVLFAVGVRTVPAGSLQFVDFSKPDPAADRVQRFMTAAQHALAEGDAELAAQRLIYARDAEPSNPMVLRLLTAAFWQAGNLPGCRACRARLGPRRHRPSHPGALRLADLRGHGRARPRRRGRRASRGARASGRLGVATSGAPAPAADGPSRRRSARSREHAASGPRSRDCSTSRSPTTSTETSGPRSRPPTQPRRSTRSHRKPGRLTRIRSPAPTASASARPLAGARSRWGTIRRSPSSSPG